MLGDGVTHPSLERPLRRIVAEQGSRPWIIHRPDLPEAVVRQAPGDRWASTVEKDAPMVAAGIRVVGVAPWTLFSRPTRFLTQLRQVVALGAPSPAPAVRVVQDAIHRGGWVP
jgi:hypothetical protein